MGVTQGGTLVHHVGAAFLWAPGHLGPTLQGLNKVFFLICHNQAMLGSGEDRELRSGLGSQDPWDPISL